MMGALRAAAIGLLLSVLVALTPGPASAIVHLAEVHEVMVDFDGDPDVQYVEINMRLGAQNITINATLASFDSTGTFIDADPGTVGDQPLITFPNNVPNSGAEIRWIVGTTEFETASGITADFVISASPGLPATVGMVCLFEAFRDFTNPFQSVDCISYGGASYTGNNPNSNPSDAATTGPGDGTKSLTRINHADFIGGKPWAQSDIANDFALRCPTPENNAGEIVLLGDDDDGDGLPNCHEGEIGSDPALRDTDGDGFSDREEYDAGSDSTDADSTPPTATPTVIGTPTDTATPSSPATPTPSCAIGDVNNDASISSIDAALILQFVAGLLGSLACLEGADTNGNGDVNSIDAALILQLSAGLIGSLTP